MYVLGIYADRLRQQHFDAQMEHLLRWDELHCQNPQHTASTVQIHDSTQALISINNFSLCPYTLVDVKEECGNCMESDPNFVSSVNGIHTDDPRRDSISRASSQSLRHTIRRTARATEILEVGSEGITAQREASLNLMTYEHLAGLRNMQEVWKFS